MNKPRKNRWSSRSTQPPATPSDPAADARRDLEAGRFREAIAGYKALLKERDSDEARRGLADAYVGRAGELAAKGMLKEALVIWENRRQLGAAAPLAAAHVALLLRLGQTPAAAALYRQARQAGDESVLQALCLKLAAHYVAGDEGIAAALAPDDPILVHGVAARAALTAYCAADGAGLATSLAAIPFRSPYRDWVQILKALQRLRDQPEEATSLLARVGHDSPFAGICRAAALALAPEPELLTQPPELGPSTARFALTLRGWGEERQALWREATRLSPSPTPLALLRLLHRHSARLGEVWVRERSLRLLVDDYPRSLQWLPETGARRATELERDLVAAWHAELGRDGWAVQDAWERYADHLAAGARPSPGSDGALRLALVMRRFDHQSDALKRAGDAGSANPLSQTAAALSEASLAHDPDDPETYLRLIAYHRGIGALKEARRFLDPALTRWPRDLRVLTAALETALAANAFKKAAGVARRILEIDPIHSGARERLVGAHIAHARKQIRGARLDLAHRELDQAAEWATGVAPRERLALTGAFLTLAEDPPAGVAALRALAEDLGGGLTGALVLAIEGAALGRPPQTLLKQLGLVRVRCRGAEDLRAFFGRLRTHWEGGERIHRGVAALFDKPLKDAAALPSSVQEVEAACETLRRCALEGARLAFAETGLKRWPGAPVLVLHAFEARHRGAYWAVSDRELDRLERALERARTEGDMRTVHRLTELLDEAEGLAVGPPGRAGDATDLPEPLMDSLIATLGLEGFLNLMGFDPDLRAKIKQVERELGRPALIELLKALARGEFPAGPPRPDPPVAPPRARPSRPPRPTPAKTGKPAGDPGDDAIPDQLDLFS